MANEKNQKLKIPVIYYEESEEGQPINPIPYIEVDKGEPWPSVLFIQEYRHTGEIEPDLEGEPQPIVDMYMHKYVDMEILKEKLDPFTNDKVRVALGMKPLLEAQKAGRNLLQSIKNKAEKNNIKLKELKEEK